MYELDNAQYTVRFEIGMNYISSFLHSLIVYVSLVQMCFYRTPHAEYFSESVISIFAPECS